MARDRVEQEVDAVNQMNTTVAFNNELMKSLVDSLKSTTKAAPAKTTAKAVKVSARPKAPAAPGIPRSAYDNKSAYQGAYKASSQAAPATPPNGFVEPHPTYMRPAYAAPSKVSDYPMSKNNPSGRNPMAPSTDSRITDISKAIQANNKKNISAPVPGSSNVTTIKTALGSMKVSREGTTEGHGKLSDTLWAASSAIPVGAGFGVARALGTAGRAAVMGAKAAEVASAAAKASKAAKVVKTAAPTAGAIAKNRTAIATAAAKTAEKATAGKAAGVVTRGELASAKATAKVAAKRAAQARAAAGLRK